MAWLFLAQPLAHILFPPLLVHVILTLFSLIPRVVSFSDGPSRLILVSVGLVPLDLVAGFPPYFKGEHSSPPSFFDCAPTFWLSGRILGQCLVSRWAPQRAKKYAILGRHVYLVVPRRVCRFTFLDYTPRSPMAFLDVEAIDPRSVYGLILLHRIMSPHIHNVGM